MRLHAIAGPVGRVLAAALVVATMAPAALAQRGRGAGPGPQAAQ